MEFWDRGIFLNGSVDAVPVGAIFDCDAAIDSGDQESFATQRSEQDVAPQEFSIDVEPIADVQASPLDQSAPGQQCQVPQEPSSSNEAQEFGQHS